MIVKQTQHVRFTVYKILSRCLVCVYKWRAIFLTQVFGISVVMFVWLSDTKSCHFFQGLGDLNLLLCFDVFYDINHRFFQLKLCVTCYSWITLVHSSMSQGYPFSRTEPQITKFKYLLTWLNQLIFFRFRIQKSRFNFYLGYLILFEQSTDLI